MRKLILLAVALTAAVAAPVVFAAVTLTANPTSVVFGSQTTLSGAVSPARAGERVTVLAQACGENAFRQITTVTTTANGAWTLTTTPAKTTTYEARQRNTRSAQVRVTVSPRIVLTRIARGRFSVRLLAADSLAGKIVVVQRYRALTGAWSRVKLVTLKAGPTVQSPIANTITSLAAFRARLARGTRVRVVINPVQAAPCYIGGRSNVVRN